jgi:hypothetical protein
MANWTGIGKDIIKEGIFEGFPDLQEGIFERFPDLIPAVGDSNYHNGEHTKLLLVGESNYFEDKFESISDFKYPNKWYFGGKDRLIPEEKKNNVNNWKGSRGHNNIFKSMKTLLDEAGKNYNSYLLQEAAYYNYFLRPATTKPNKSFQKDCKPIDCQVSYLALRGIIDEIKPNIVIFVSKYSHDKFMEFFEKEKNHFENVIVEYVNHFSQACWYDANGQQKFEDLLWKYWIQPINPIIKEQTRQVFNYFQANPFWNKENWGEIIMYDEKDGTCAYFDNISKNISIDIYCAENDKYQFQIFERDKFKTKKPSGVEWIQNIPNLTTKGSRHESRLQSRQDITEILERLMK